MAFRGVFVLVDGLALGEPDVTQRNLRICRCAPKRAAHI
jgi:hypothetical protein